MLATVCCVLPNLLLWALGYFTVWCPGDSLSSTSVTSICSFVVHTATDTGLTTVIHTMMMCLSIHINKCVNNISDSQASGYALRNTHAICITELLSVSDIQADSSWRLHRVIDYLKQTLAEQPATTALFCWLSWYLGTRWHTLRDALAV